MPIRLIPKHTTPIVIRGTTFHVKQLDAAQKMVVAFALSRKELMTITEMRNLMATVASAVDRVDGFEHVPVVDLLVNSDDPNDFWTLLNGTYALSTLTEGEAKNSGSSPSTVASSQQASSASSEIAEPVEIPNGALGQGQP